MTTLIAVICLLAGLGAGIFALRPRSLQSLDVAVDVSDQPSDTNFSLSRSLLLIGEEVDDENCKKQQTELKRIVNPLLKADFKIIELYGEEAPTQNGEPLEWLDNPLMRRTLNAEEGFHLIHVNRQGQTSFHSGRPITAEALLHIFDLWDFITEEDGEELTNVEEEPTLQADPKQEAGPVVSEKNTPPKDQTKQSDLSERKEPVLGDDINDTDAYPPLTAEPIDPERHTGRREPSIEHKEPPAFLRKEKKQSLPPEEASLVSALKEGLKPAEQPRTRKPIKSAKEAVAVKKLNLTNISKTNWPTAPVRPPSKQTGARKRAPASIARAIQKHQQDAAPESVNKDKLD